jgi:hypothetical protein
VEISKILTLVCLRAKYSNSELCGYGRSAAFSLYVCTPVVYQKGEGDRFQPVGSETVCVTLQK